MEGKINNLKVNVNKVTTETIYRMIRAPFVPLVRIMFKPIVLNKEFIPKDGSIIFAPNHRSTLDPILIASITNKPIHWFALKRFFDAKDSIFNNNKNVILCYMTAILFRAVGALPIERKRDLLEGKDNKKRILANIKSLEVGKEYLEKSGNVGIFAEGTTNKNPEKIAVDKLEPTLVRMAMDTNSWIQPLSIVWVKDKQIKNKLVVYFHEPYKGIGSTKEENEKLHQILVKGVEINKNIINNLKEIESEAKIKEKNKKLILKIQK